MRSTPWKVKSQLPEFYQTKINIGSMTQSKARYIKTMTATSYKQLYYANPAKKHNNDTLPPPHSQTESTYTSIFYNKKLTVLKLQNFGQPNTNCTASNKLLLPLPFRPTTQFISELNGWISGCCLNERKFERVIDLMCMVDVVCFIYISYIIVLLQGWFCTTTIGRGRNDVTKQDDLCSEEKMTRHDVTRDVWFCGIWIWVLWMEIGVILSRLTRVVGPREMVFELCCVNCWRSVMPILQ